MTESVSGSAGLMLYQAETAAGRPLRAMIEISDRCNEVCVHCYQEQGKKGEMTTQQVKDVMDELARSGVLVLTISGGEATLRKDFLELCAYARKLGFAVRLFTNGLTMTRELARALGELAFQVVEISLYSHRAEVHDFITGVPGSFEKSTAGIRYLVAERVHVAIKTPLMSVNEHELDEYAALAKELGATFSFDPTPLMPREARERDPQAFDRSNDSYRDALHKLVGRGKETALRPGKPLDAKMCGAAEYLLVEPDGEIRPCTMLHLDLGNATRGGLTARTENERYKQLASLRWSDVHGCRDCHMRGYCGHCYASALAESGDALAPYASACAQARVHYEVATGVAPRVLGDGPEGSESIGPYRHVGGHTFERIADEVTAADDELAARFGWIRQAGGRLPATTVVAKPGELVQIRRPGRARARLERIPGSVHAAPASDRSQTQSLSVSDPTA